MSLTITRPALPVPLTLVRGGTEATNPAGARAKLELGDLALLTAPGGTTTFLRADKTWAVPAGGGGGAPTDAEYITSTTNATLSAERVLTDTATVTWDRATAGQIKANAVGGSGDVSSNTASSVEGELALFTGTTGKLLKRSVSSGLARVTAGVMGTVTAPTGAVVGTTDTQTLTGKTIAGASNTLTIREADLSFTDIATANVSLTAHGLVPKAPGGTTAFLRGDATWAVPAGGGGGAPTDAEYITSTVNGTLSAERVLTDTATITWDRTTAGEIKANAIGGGGYTDEQAQDAMAAAVANTGRIQWAYNDTLNQLSCDIFASSIGTAQLTNDGVTEAKLGFSDVTTKDASTTAHGLLRKLSGTATQYLDGSGAWTTPAGGGTNYWSRGGVSSDPLLTDMLAFWHLEEATGNRLDSVGTHHLVPTGTTVQVTNAAGKIGQALAMTGASGTYLSVPDSPTLSAGPNQSFTVAIWAYVATTAADMGFVGKGSMASATAGAEYQLWMFSGLWYLSIGNGATAVSLSSPTTPVINTWTLLVGWYDAVADIQYLQVNNGTPAQVANAVGSYDSGFSFDVGRACGHSSRSLNGRLDMPAFWKRVLTPAERTTLYGGGAGWNPPFAAPYLSPLTVTDRLVLATTPLSAERLEVDGAIKVGTTTGLIDGTLRWSGTDFEGRKGGAWVSMTSGGGQPLDATLTALAGLATGADQLPYSIGTDAFAQTAFTAVGRTLVGAVDAAAQRTALALGTMAQQDAASVAITGGSATLTSLVVPTLPSGDGVGVHIQMNDGGTFRRGLYISGTALSQSAGPFQFDHNLTLGQTSRMGVGVDPHPSHMVKIWYPRSTTNGVTLQPNGDTGVGAACNFVNTADTSVGSITTTATTTAYNTTSDVRLKDHVEPLTGALDVVRALNPVAHRWRADDSLGVGFLAHEVQQVVDGVTTGEKDELNPDGTIKPQMIDYSKLVPWLVSAVKELTQQVEILQAQLAEAGA